MRLRVSKAPLFTVHAVGWVPPEPDRYDAVMVTSAHAPLHAGSDLLRYVDLPCYAVGEASGAAARAAGLATVREGPTDGAALVAMMAGDGVRSAVHLCGRDHKSFHHPLVQIDPLPVYTTEAVERLPDSAVAAIKAGAVALLHSPRAAHLFARVTDVAGLRRDTVAIVAISDAALAAAGSGWHIAKAAKQPRDPALLELAAELCQSEMTTATGRKL